VYFFHSQIVKVRILSYYVDSSNLIMRQPCTQDVRKVKPLKSISHNDKMDEVE
jgi:hypothetical protein